MKTFRVTFNNGLYAGGGVIAATNPETAIARAFRQLRNSSKTWKPMRKGEFTTVSVSRLT